MVNHMQRARMHRAAVLDLLGRFLAMSRSHVADVLFGGNARAANRVLLSLARTGRLYRFPLMPRGEYVYSLTKRPVSHLEHHLGIAGLFAALVRTAPVGPKVFGAANVELQKGLITDLLAVSGHWVVLSEIHLGTNSFGSKLDRYSVYRASGLREQAPWWEPGMKVIVWLVGPAAAVPRLDRAAAAHRVAGLRVVVTHLRAAMADPWGCLGLERAVEQHHVPAAPESVIRWRFPLTRGRTPSRGGL